MEDIKENNDKGRRICEENTKIGRRKTTKTDVNRNRCRETDVNKDRKIGVEKKYPGVERTGKCRQQMQNKNVNKQV